MQQDDQKTLSSICDEYLAKILKLLRAEIVVAVGKFAEKKVTETAKTFNLSCKVRNLAVTYFAIECTVPEIH